MAVAIVKDDSVIFAKGYGVRELGRPERVDENTLFAVGSQTKAFTAAALAILVDEGKLKWDDPVVKYVPQFELSDPELTRRLSIRDCLTHRSGFDPLSAQFLFIDLSREEILRRYRFAKPTGVFRASFDYNNILFLLAGQVIPAASGMTWDEFVVERIFKPLGMKASNTSITRYSENANRASAHEIIDGKVRNIPLLNADNYAPAGSINSNLADMAQWLRMQMGAGLLEKKQVVSTPTMNEMHTPQVMASFPPVFADMPFVSTYAIQLTEPLFLTYGLGWFIQEYRGKRLIHHGGDIDGQRSQVGFMPDLNLGVVILSNLHPATLAEAALFSVMDGFLGGETRNWSGELLSKVRAYRAKMSESRQRVLAAALPTPPTVPLERFAGAYDSEAYGPARVVIKDGAVELRLGRLTCPLRHSQGNAFLIDTPGILGRLPLTFIVSRSGEVAGMRLLGITEFKRIVEK
jgi:CubicO group peptidase (beta-lactamase class C family)